MKISGARVTIPEYFLLLIWAKREQKRTARKARKLCQSAHKDMIKKL